MNGKVKHNLTCKA